MAFDSDDAPDPATPPISRHPAFPAVVALWFAALLGIGSLILPVILLERVVEAIGLSAIIPAASPPLGVSARAMVAVVGAVVGALVGAVLARQVALSHGAASRADERRPISAHDELGDEGLGPDNLGMVFGEKGNSGVRRRSLAMAEDSRSSDYLWLAPLPGELEQPAEMDATDLAGEDAALELDGFARVGDDTDDLIPAQDTPMANDTPAQFPSAEERERRRADRRTGQHSAAVPDPERRVQMLRVADEPLPFVAPWLSHQAAANEAPGTAQDSLPESQTGAESIEHDGDEQQPLDLSSAPLERLGMMQLVQRLGSSLEKRRERLAQVQSAPSFLAAVPEGFEPAAPEMAAQAMAAYFGRGTSDAEGPSGESSELTNEPVPANEPEAEPLVMLSAQDAEEEEEDDEFGDEAAVTASFALPLRRQAAPIATTEAAESDDDTPYSSLLRVNPFAPRADTFVRVEEPEEDEALPPPAVVFPGREQPAPVASSIRMFDPPASTGRVQAPAPAPAAAPVDSDEALRTALATLQRMSSGR